MSVDPPTTVDLFCGAGGLSLGFHAAGAVALAAVDVDESAASSFALNFSKLQPSRPPVVFAGDDANIEYVDFQKLSPEIPDILIGGPPCQGFSRIGRAKLDSLSEGGFAGDARNELYRRFLDAARYWLPKAIVMENVPGMLSVRGKNIAEAAARDIAGIGYRVGYALLNAAWYGVPQLRERLFFIALRADLGVEPVAPAATRSVSNLPAGYSRPRTQLTLPLMEASWLAVQTRAHRRPTTVREALDDLPPLTQHLEGPRSKRFESRSSCTYRSEPASRYAELMRSWPGFQRTSGVADHVIRRTPRDYETFRRMQPGDRYPQAVAIAHTRLAEELERLGSNAPAPGSEDLLELQRRFVPPYPVDIFVDKWRKLIPDEPAWTVPAHLAKDAYSHIHYDDAQARAISLREAARLQSFPDSFAFCGNLGDGYRQVGNAVPPIMAWSVATSVLAAIGAGCNPPPV